MTIQARAVANCSEITIAWRCDKPIKNCRGFALHRRSTGASGQVQDTAVDTWVGFEGEPDAQSGVHKPSTTWPIQRFIWSDYFSGGSDIQYQVVPMVGPDKQSLKPGSDVSNWTDPVRLGTGSSPGFSAWFNRGIVASQWVARATAQPGASPTSTLVADIAAPGNALRNELGGPLLANLARLLAQSQAAGEIIYAALYELNDQQLKDLLSAYGKNCHLILANGVFKSGKPDENSIARAELKKARQVDLSDRMVSSGHFAHNKFLVFCDSAGTPQRLWTGSTNWTNSGLCTQVNNGLLVEDAGIAAAYLERWKQIKAAKNAYPPELSAAGSIPAHSQQGPVHMTAWNAPVNKLVDLADARQLILGARQGVLFLMFNPGPKGTLLNDILSLNQKDLFVHGVVNQDPGGKTPILTFHDRGTPIDANPEVVLPKALKGELSPWFSGKELTEMVMIHSKVVVVDPFGPHPVVMTGSHNLGPKASGKNDDNLLIIENAPGLAAEYAVNIMGVYGHYKYRHNLFGNTAADAQGSKKDLAKWKGLQDNDTWQNGYFVAAKEREIDFWFGDIPSRPQS